MIDLAVSEFGRLDIVFNNAGVGGALGPIWDVEVEEWDYTFDVLAKGVFLGIKHAARAMKRSGRGGSIINTASIAGLSGGGGPLVYSAAKAAVINLTRGGRASARGRSHPGQCDLSRRSSYAAHRSRRSRCRRQANGPIPAVAGARQARAYRGRRAVSRERRFRIRHRRSTGRRWRIDRRRSGYLAQVRSSAGSGTIAGGPESRQHRRGEHAPPGAQAVGRPQPIRDFNATAKKKRVVKVSKDSIDLGIIVTDEKAVLNSTAMARPLMEGELPLPGGRMYRLKIGITFLKLLKLERLRRRSPHRVARRADSVATATSRSRCPIFAD